MHADFELKDTLTAAFSRRCFEEMFQEEINRSIRYNEPLSILVLDIDHFKSINDGFGHQRGDAVLVEFADRINQTIRGSDRLFRYGGDEFIVLLPGTSRAQAILAAHRLKQAISETPFPGDPDLTMGLSIGISSLDDAMDPGALFAKADARLLEAKYRGRNQIISEDPVTNNVLHLPVMDRLLDREESWGNATGFLEENHRKALLCITGIPASGRSRFLEKIAGFAGMKQFRVISIRGRLAVRHQPYGVLEQVLSSLSIRLPDQPEADDFLRAMLDFINNGSTGSCLITVDDVSLLDRSTLTALTDLMNHPVSIPVVLAYTEDIDRPLIPFNIPDCVLETIEMKPLSKASLGIWLRSMLCWEADDAFLEWLHGETQGLPGNVERVVSYLIKRGIMVREQKNGWTFTMDYRGVQPAKRLLFHTKKQLHNLPSNLTEFIGREKEVSELSRLLDDYRLVTLTGSGGSGKTRLAIRVASERINHFRDGVFFIPLESIRSHQFITSIMAEVLSFTFFGSFNPRTQLLNYLQEKEMLLVMDTLEHLLAGSELISEILECCPDIRILATSRELLNIKGEKLFEVHGLSLLPRTGSVYSISPAAELFIRTATRIQPEFSVNDANREDIERICRLLDGMPLGIELAAAWTPVCSCAEISREIEKNLDFLKSDHSSTPSRHRSIRAVFEHSWGLLDQAERRILTCLSVFTGGFSREAAEEITGGSLRQLLSLKDKSLLYHSASGRFYLLGILKQYSEEKLNFNPDEKKAFQQAHSRYFAYLIKSMKIEIDNQQDYLSLVAVEIENIRDGFKFAAQNQSLEDLPSYIAGLGLYYIGMALYEEGEQVFGYASRIIREAADQTGTKDPDPLRNILGEIMLFRGWFAFNLGLFYLSRDSYQTCLDIFRETGLIRGIADALDGLGNVSRRLGEPQKALSYHQRSLSLQRSIQNDSGIAATLHNIARVMNMAGNVTQARHFYEDSLQIYRELNDRRQIAAVLLDLGICLGKLGDIDRRSQYLTESLQIRKQLADSAGIASSLDMLGYMELSLGNHARAKQLLIESLDIRRRIHDRWGIASSLLDLGSVLKSLGEYDEARRLYEESLGIFTEIGYKRGAARVLNRLGELIIQTESVETAEPFMQRGLKHFQDINDQLGVCQCNLNLGICAFKSGRISEAESIYRQVIKDSISINQIEITLECLISMAQILSCSASRTDHESALELLGFVSKHRILNKESRDRMMPLKREIQGGMPQEAAERAFSRGTQQGLDDIVRQMN